MTKTKLTKAKLLTASKTATSRKAGGNGGNTKDGESGTDAPATRPTSKLDLLVRMLSRPEGASITELAAATGWQAHSVRGALAGSLKKKGHIIRSEKIDGERHYQIESQA